MRDWLCQDQDNTNQRNKKKKLLSRKQVIRISFGSKLDYVYNKNIAPGPGNYEIKSKVEKIGTKFGTERRENSNENRKNLLIPGPGAYNSNSFIGETSKHRFSGGAKGSSYKDPNPGPGAYNITERVGREGVKNSLYGRPKSTKGLKNVPGPGAYDPKLKEFVPSYKLSPELKRSASNILNVPGPGQYSLDASSGLSINKKSPTWRYAIY